MPVRTYERRRKSRGVVSLGILSLILSWFVFPLSLSACPAFLLGRHIPFLDRGQILRQKLALFRFVEGRWQGLPMQLDPLDREGALIFPKDKAWMNEPFGFMDRLSFYVDGFAGIYDRKAPLPCAAKEVIELKHEGKFAYLMDCEPQASVNAERPITHDEKQRTVSSDDYLYRYTPSNHLVFENIEIRSGESRIPVAKESDLFIVGDVKNFFTLTFDSSDIDAEIIHKRQGPLGLMGGMEFFLRIMAFKINLELLPEVNFFRDSLFMPMSMTLPVDARKYLRRGSGIYYSWAAEKDVVWQWDDSALDQLDVELLNPDGKGPLAKPSPKHCNARQCHYTIKGLAKGRPFVLNFRIAKKTADLGFFPQLIRDVPQVEKTLGRKVSRFPAEGRTAIYFETARLPEGTHTWDFWIYFPDQGASDSCLYKIQRENLNLSQGKP